MSELRLDPVTNEWVIIAPERGVRPHEGSDTEKIPTGGEVKKKDEKEGERLEKRCPFCPGDEENTGLELERINDEDGKWLVRVVCNKYPNLRPEGTVLRRREGIFAGMDGYGRAEVVIESPIHEQNMAQMSENHILQIFRVYKLRYLAALKDEKINLITIFRNKGNKAGASLMHPHSQIISQPIVPKHIRQKIQASVEYYDNEGECIFCRVMEEEKKAGKRMVLETEYFSAFCPWASKYPYEILILPKRHNSAFSSINDREISDIAGLLKRLLNVFCTLLKDPDYNLIIHSAPREEDPAAYYHWHIAILPRIATTAGFEIGSGTYVSIVSPETAAAKLSEVYRNLYS
ncbi:MAG: galactose-1-phosphate uridylyltransferase [Thermoplasmata archaeon]